MAKDNRIVQPPDEGARAKVYDATMTRVQQLMDLDPESGTSEGEELSLLTDVAMFYERGILQPLCPGYLDDIEHRLTFMAEGIRAQEGFNWGEFERVCRDAHAAISALKRRVPAGT